MDWEEKVTEREEKEIVGTCRTSIKLFKSIHMTAILPLKDEASNAADTLSCQTLLLLSSPLIA